LLTELDGYLCGQVTRWSVGKPASSLFNSWHL